MYILIKHKWFGLGLITEASRGVEAQACERKPDGYGLDFHSRKLNIKYFHFLALLKKFRTCCLRLGN